MLTVRKLINACLISLVLWCLIFLAIDRTLAYPVLGWHPSACLCNVCLTQYDDERR
jgi:hypothetical protein